MYVEVAVDTYQDPTKKLFTYQVPENLEQKAVEGVKVAVPFGKRIVEGYIWSTTPKKPSFPTKPIAEVKGQTFNENQIKLAGFISRYYLASPLESLKCQLGKRGERSTTAKPDKITTLILVPYASQVKIRALAARKKREKALVGSRGAVFVQLPTLKRIIVEEPENWSYKDERAPYYHAADIAKKRAKLEGLKLELNHQIPRLEDVVKKRVELPKVKPVKIVDLQSERKAGNFSPISAELEENIKRRARVIIFANSKEAKEEVREAAQKIGADRSFTRIFGPELFSIPAEEADIVFWADADTLLNLPDFRVSERVAWAVTKLTQVAKGQLYLQTSNPDNETVQNLAKGDLAPLYNREKKQRKKLHYPPYSTLVKLTYTSKSAARTSLEAAKLHEKLMENSEQRTVEISPPYEPYSKTPRKIRLNIAVKIKAKSPSAALAKLSKVIPPNWRVEVDPENLL